MATGPPPMGPDGKINFPNMLGAKRRRMRSGGNVSTDTNNAPKQVTSTLDVNDEKVAETSRCKGATTIPIFLKKTYKMIETCDPAIASWTQDGEMFVVKNPDLFASNVIPQYFDHNKFSSFARQLNFYGFRKMQAKPIRNADFDVDTAKHVTFYNEKFKRGRCDMLKDIQRSTRGGNATGGGGEKEVQALRDQVHALENQVDEMNNTMEDRMRRLELDMLNRMEQIMLAMQQHQQQTSIMHQQSIGSLTSAVSLSQKNNMMNQQMQSVDVGNNLAWDPLPLDTSKGGMRMTSMGNVNIVSQDLQNNAPKMQAPATLPPHPKQKQLPPTGLPGSLNLPPSRLNSLMSRNLSRGVSGLSVESSASAVLLRNSWEDKFFSMLMLGESEANAQQQAHQQQQQQAQQQMISQINANNVGSMSDANAQLHQHLVMAGQMRSDDDFRSELQQTHEL